GVPPKGRQYSGYMIYLAAGLIIPHQRESDRLRIIEGDDATTTTTTDEAPEMLSLTTKQRDELLTLYRKDPDPELRFRAHIILLLGAGPPWDTIEAMLFCSSRTVDRWLKRFRAEGVAGLTGRKRGRPFRLDIGWVALLVCWVTTKVPSDFGLLRS